MFLLVITCIQNMKISQSNFWRNTLHYIDHDIWPDFNFDQNQLKVDTQHKDMYVYQKKFIKIENSLEAIINEIWSKTL